MTTAQYLPISPVRTDAADITSQAPRIAVGTFLTAVAAALAAVVGVIAIQGIGHLPMNAGGLTEHLVLFYGLAAAGFAVVASLVNLAIARVAPHPTLFYGWLMALLIMLAVLAPFVGGITMTAAALAGLHLFVGTVVATLVPAATSAERL